MAGVLSELTCLGLHRPGPDAAPVVLAAWFERVAVVHDRLAAESSGAEAALERRLAAQSHQRAKALVLPTEEGIKG